MTTSMMLWAMQCGLCITHSTRVLAVVLESGFTKLIEMGGI